MSPTRSIVCNTIHCIDFLPDGKGFLTYFQFFLVGGWTAKIPGINDAGDFILFSWSYADFLFAPGYNRIVPILLAVTTGRWAQGCCQGKKSAYRPA